MNGEELNKWTIGFGLATAVASLFNASLVVLKETYRETLFVWMTQLTGHHWVAHSILSLIVFFGCGWLFTRFAVGQTFASSANRLIVILMGSVVVSVLLIAGYYLAHC